MQNKRPHIKLVGHNGRGEPARAVQADSILISDVLRQQVTRPKAPPPPPENPLNVVLSSHKHTIEAHAVALQKTAVAVNRLEAFTFALVKLLEARGVIQHADLRAAMDDLAKHTDLNVYFGIEPIAVEDAAQPEE